ncbi:MAG: hypothetical protein DMG23_11225 [Acidobacteria bacterium]|nr:MAG: hypothetical protein DMG23_11225 [Acidobacteriota bacterium]
MPEPHWKVEVLLAGSWRGATSVLLSNGRSHAVVDTGLPHEAHQLVSALGARGLRPEDVKILINTHFHVDHVLNNWLFPSAQIYAPKESYDWCRSLYDDLLDQHDWARLVLKYYPETFEYVKAKENLEKMRNFVLRWWDVKRLGAPTQFKWLENENLPEDIEVVRTSGHVPGHVSLIIRNSNGTTVIAGDVVLSREHEERVLTMIPFNRKQFQADRARLLSIHGRMIPGHDREFVVLPGITAL